MSSAAGIECHYEAAYAGPELWQLSKGSYRRNLRTNGSSEKSHEGTRLEQEEFRVGAPLLKPMEEACIPIPMALEVVVNGHVFCMRLEVERILERHGIDLEYVLHTHHPALGYPSTLHSTIYVVARATCEFEDEWLAPARDLHERLVDMGVGSSRYGIEIVDRRFCEKTVWEAVRAADPITHDWQLVQQEIVARLKGRRWVTLSLLRRGKETGPKVVTVVVTVRAASSEDWALVRDELVQILNARGLFWVAVEIVRDVYHANAFW